MSLTLNLYHIVISTKYRRMTINPEHERDLYRYLWSLLDGRKCKLLRMGGIANHVHILADLHPTVSLAAMAGELKRKSSLWMKRSGLFPIFEGWGEDYFGVSKSSGDRDVLINYIKNQKEHHKNTCFEEEYRRLVEGSGRQWDDRFLT